MPLLSWLSRKSPEEDYEQVLASLAIEIQKRQTKLSEIRLRERRATLLVTSWAFAAWAAYVGLWWAGVVGRSERGWNGVLRGLPVVVGPVVILFTRRIVQLWYARKGDAEEKTLKKLLVQQRNKIEEIKKKTNYYTTKNLLDRYDEGSPRRNNASDASGVQKRGPPAPIHPQSQARPNGSNAPTPGPQAPQTPVRGATQGQGQGQGQPFSPIIPTLPAPRKQWYDKVADALLGDDTASTGPSPASRYALICERCFSHNGLVKEEQWENAQYVCPKCGYFNPSVRSRKAGATSPTTPQSALSPSTVPLPSSAVSPEFPEGQQPPTSPQREPSPRSPLSASTVLVEKKDVEDQAQDQAGEGHESKTAGVGEGDKAMQMDVDL